MTVAELISRLREMPPGMTVTAYNDEWACDEFVKVVNQQTAVKGHEDADQTMPDLVVRLETWEL